MNRTRWLEALRHIFEEEARPERNPDDHRLESLDDWILFGPRMR